ncbi:hypothetical protein [Streptomyces sp. NBC_00996]|nr:hypothetical protein OG390_47000 [Streptomyces sp. NBC_00996]
MSMVPETSQRGALVAVTSQSGMATVSTLNWMAMMPPRAVISR